MRQLNIVPGHVFEMNLCPTKPFPLFIMALSPTEVNETLFMC